MENMEVVMNEVEVMENAAEVVEVPAENNGLKIALTVGAIVLGGYLLYKKVIKPAIERKKINTNEDKDVNANVKPEGMRAANVHEFHS